MLDSKALAEQANYKFAHEWFAGLGLTVDGVEIGDTVEYDLLALLGRAYLSEGVKQDGQPA